jgi:DNA-binding transcriptional LysR family regulator
LTSHNCLGYTLSRLTGVERWAFGRQGDVEVPVSGNLRANNGDALRLAAAAGHGIIYQPTFLVAEDLRAGTLVRIELDHPPIELGGIYGVFLPSLHPAAKIRAFIDFLLAHFSAEPPWDRA